MNSNEIGKFIKELREKKKWNQEELARRLHVTRQAISSWENGKYIPDILKLKIMSEIFNVDITELYAGKKLNNDIQKNEIVYNVVKNEKSKTKRLLVVFFVLFFILAFCFLGYYFVNSYKSINVYTIGGNSDSLSATGLMISTKDKTYFQLSVDGASIKEMSLRYRDDEIYRIDDSEIRFRDSYGYNEYVSFDSLEDWKNNLFLNITDFQNQTYEIKLNFNKDFENDDLFFQKESLGATTNTDNETNTEIYNIPQKIIDTFNYEDENYKMEYKHNDKTITLIYMTNADLFIVDEFENNILKSWRYFVLDNSLYYEEVNEDGDVLYEFNSTDNNANLDKNKELSNYFQVNYFENYFN